MTERNTSEGTALNRIIIPFSNVAAGEILNLTVTRIASFSHFVKHFTHGGMPRVIVKMIVEKQME
jgi:hypothetical protein